MPAPRNAGRGVRRSKEEKEKAGKALRRLLADLFRRYPVHLILVVILIVISVLANVRGTLFIQTLIDGYINPMLKGNSRDFTPLLNAIRQVAAIYIVGILATYFYNLLMVYVNQGMLRMLRDKMFSHMESLPIRYFDTHAHGDIMSCYTNDIDTLRQMISQALPQMINASIMIAAVLVSMIYLSPVLTIITLGMTAVMIFVTGKAASISGRFYTQQQTDIGALNGNIEEMMTGQKVVKIFNHEEKVIEEFDRRNESLYRSSSNANSYANILGPVNNQLGNVSYVLVAVAGGAMAVSGFGSITLGKLASFLSFNKSFNMPISQVSQQLNFIVMAAAGASRIYAMLDEETEKDEGYVTLVNAKEENGELTETDERTGEWAWKHQHQADGSVDYKRLSGDIVMEDVNFGYTPDKQVLYDISLYARPGQKVAFVGATGAGKTTITNLINRFYDVEDGKIRYDGININKIRKPDLRRSLGIVLQDTHLFTGTVAENIRYGKLDATDEEVIAAAKLANADGFIRHLKDGYDTVLKGDGSNLSAGQRQLLAIARAAIADPPALILDEATSSIDTRTERIVQDGMDRLMAGRTTFVIAHRLSTIRNSDVIMVLDQGHIIERGNHEELMAKQGKYYQLYTGRIVNA
ncbi:MAG: ABC transporter ATP-binding protein [Lachnospiraceae bacterium]|nr:ABC transporter ATP-binding protein/permease [Lachnospiraceae bacterium]MDD7326858.1 ABC transporter ATP-binding protein [Lachnospiraceae bacterium]MDY2759504.1 ABC transporter ATP-binding protein [Lachnospiraceae bacterium]